MSVSLGQEIKVNNIVCNTINGQVPSVPPIATQSTSGTVTLASAIDSSTNGGKVPTASQIVAYVGANGGSGGTTNTSTSTNFGTDTTAITGSSYVSIGNLNSATTAVFGGNAAIVSSSGGVVAINNTSTSGQTKINNNAGGGGVIIGNASSTVSLYGTVSVGGTSLATVATSGNYNDLINKPTIPTVPTLATVATSGSYLDLTNKPSIPSITLASAIDNAGNANNVPTAGQIVSYVTSNSVSFTPGFDIIVINGQSNGVGCASDTKDAVLDAPVSDLPIFMLTTTTGTANSVVNAIEHIDSVNGTGSTFGNVAVGQNTSIFTFAKLYARNYLQPGRKILIVNNCVAATGIAGQNTTGMSAAMTVSGMPSGVSTVNLNWTPNSVASGTPLSKTYTVYTSSGATSGSTTTKSVTVGSGTSSDNIYNLYNLALYRTQIALNASIDLTPGIDTTDGLNTGTNKVVALLWQQGESDSFENALPLAQYQTSLTALIDGYRALCGSSVPFLVGGFTPSFISGAWIAGTAAAAAQYTTYFKSFGTASSPRAYTGYADSQSPTAAPDNTGVHFTCAGYRIMGQRYFKAYQYALTNTPTPATLTSASGLTTSVGSYNATTNTYPVTITGFTATGATTYNVYYGTTSTPATQVSAGNITSTSSSSIVFNITPSSSVLSYYFKIQVYNSFNTPTYPSVTSSTAISIPAALAPVINGLNVPAATIYGITVQATSVSNYALTSDTVVLSFSSGAITVNTTVSALLAGDQVTPSQAGYVSTLQFPTTTQLFSATCTNSVSGLTSASASSAFTPTSSIISTLTTSAINPTYFTVNWTLSSSTGLNTQTLTIAASSTPTTYLVNTTVAVGTLTYTIATNLLTAGTSYIVTLTCKNASSVTLGTQAITQFTTPTLTITSSSLSAAAALNVAYTVSPSSSAITWTYASTTSSTTILNSGGVAQTSSGSPINPTLTGLVFGQSYIFTLYATPPSYSGSTTSAVASTTVTLAYNTSFALDTVSASSSASGIFACKRVLTSYTGYILRLATSSAGTTYVDFNSDGNGNLTTGGGVTLATWMSANSVTTPYVLTWYDQSPAGNHATAPGSNAPTYDTTNKRVAFASGQYLSIASPGSMSLGDGAFTFTSKVGTTPTNYGWVFGSGTNATFNMCDLIVGGASQNFMSFDNGGSADTTWGTPGIAANQPFTYKYTGGGASTNKFLYINGTSNTNISIAGVTRAKGSTASINYIGRYGGDTAHGGSYPLLNSLYYVSLYTSALSDADRTIVEAQ